MVSRVIAKTGDYTPVSGTVSARCREHGIARHPDGAHRLRTVRRPLEAMLRRICGPTRHPMIADIDIWRAANILVKRHGADARIAAAQRADELLARR
jgi:hypothetical protein